MSAQTKTVWIQALAALKGPSHKIFCFAPMHLIGLEMVRDAFLAPHLGRKVPQSAFFGANMVKGPHHQGRLTRDRGGRPWWGKAHLVVEGP